MPIRKARKLNVELSKASKAGPKTATKSGGKIPRRRRKPAKSAAAPAVRPAAIPAVTALAAAPVPPEAPPQEASSPEILIWEDDPESVGAAPVTHRGVPGDRASRFQLNIIGETPAPGRYERGSAEFRYWNARAALVRCRDFWEPLLPSDTVWQTGSSLPVVLDAGVKLNAFYNRLNGLTFYRDRVEGELIYVAESPDVACHELGHAVLDALQPALWIALTTETAAFHEAFGDISALLSALRTDSFCGWLLDHHGAHIERDSRWTRIGEALGKALHRREPGTASPGWLRNASNSYFYRPPSELPASGPDTELTREPHSLARVFVSAFLNAFAGVARADAQQLTVESVQDTAWKMAAWLVVAVRKAPVQPDYFFQVASALTAEAAAQHPEGRDQVASAFVRRGILPVDALANGWPQIAPKQPSPEAIPVTAAPIVFGGFGVAPIAAPVSQTAIDARLFGLRTDNLILPGRAERLAVPRPRAFDLRGAHRSAAPSLAEEAALIGAGAGAVGPHLGMGAAPTAGVAQPLEHEEGFIHYLFQRGRVEFAPDTLDVAPAGPVFSRKTHRLARTENGEVTIERITFDCGFD